MAPSVRCLLLADVGGPAQHHPAADEGPTASALCWQGAEELGGRAQAQVITTGRQASHELQRERAGPGRQAGAQGALSAARSAR